MKEFVIPKNNYLAEDMKGYYNRDYVGYQKPENPDFINHLKNMTRQYDELDLAPDFVEVFEIAYRDISQIVKKERLDDCAIVVVPRSKKESSYVRSQLVFKKIISCVADKLELGNATDAIKRIKDTRTTHSWRMENNTGEMPYVGITKDTCELKTSSFRTKDVILVDDIYTKGVFVAEDCAQSLLDFGAKRVILYVIAKTRYEK